MAPYTMYLAERFSREKRKQQIVELFRQWNKKTPGAGATKHKVARALEIRASEYLLDLLWEMAEERLLVGEVGIHWNGWPRHTFSLPAETFGDK